MAEGNASIKEEDVAEQLKQMLCLGARREAAGEGWKGVRVQQGDPEANRLLDCKETSVSQVPGHGLGCI